MKTIKNTEFAGERPLYCQRDLKLENVTIHAGESALKETANIEAVGCRFEGKYPFWECDTFKIRNCVFTEGARAAIWYSWGCEMSDCIVEAPKMFRRMDGIVLRRVRFTNASETLWDCTHVDIDDIQLRRADYLFVHGSEITIRNMQLQGNYSFQYARNVVISDSELDSKDAFWECENVTLRNCRINGEYLGWYSKNLHLINCRIGGTQPLCYCDGLILDNCTFDSDADLAFEYSNVRANVTSRITSIKNPRSGYIKAEGGYGSIIIDENIKAPGDCVID